MSMVKVHFIRKEISLEVTEGDRLSKCIRAAGLILETPCNGLGLCGKCRVKAWGELYPRRIWKAGSSMPPTSVWPVWPG